MRLVLDIETNSLTQPSKIWVVVSKDLDTGEMYVHREPTRENEQGRQLVEHLNSARWFVGHNFLGFDWPHLERLLGVNRVDVADICSDTLILSRLIDYPRNGHSIEDYGLEFGYPKIKFTDFSKYSKEMEDYCVRDVQICERVYNTYIRYVNNPKYRDAIILEHRFQQVCNELNNRGFAFNLPAASKLLEQVKKDLEELDKDLLEQFKPRLKLVREVTPKETKHGTIARNSVPKALGNDLSAYTVGSPFSYCEWVDFNPGSPRQVVRVLNEAGWKPTDKTDTHKELERLKNQRKEYARDKLATLQEYGWKINETNLSTLPEKAPKAARTLAKRIVLESRRKTLTEWVTLCRESRIHGEFTGIGAWTHRMSHQRPNTANIPNEKDNNGQIKLLGGAMRKLWIAPKNRLLVGVDAEGIQLRVFAHYVENKELIEALEKGSKSNKTDPHSYNQRILGDVCKTRTVAKRYLYALFLGAGRDKLKAILECGDEDADAALSRLLAQYPGFEHLKRDRFPADAKRGYFTALDGRPIKVPGEDLGTKRHLMMSGYLQSGEAIIMKRATLKWLPRLPKEASCFLVDFVHDEWQSEVVNNMELAIEVAKIQCQALEEVGVELGLKIKLAGSYWNDDLNDYTIGTNWKVTH